MDFTKTKITCSGSGQAPEEDLVGSVARTGTCRECGHSVRLTKATYALLKHGEYRLIWEDGRVSDLDGFPLARA